jgi:hypothetical protein
MNFYVERAARLNRHYMRPQAEGWQRYFDDIARLVGFEDSSPSEWEFAEAMARWQRGQRPPLTDDGVVGPRTWTRLRHLLGVGRPGGLATGKVPTASAIPHAEPMTLPGPQSFAPAVPGTTPIDQWLIARNMHIEQGLLRAADEYYASGDFRWFFSYAHGEITRQINRNLERLQRPNALLRLNMHFAEEFLRAIGGQSHDGWKRAFRVCQSLRDASADTSLLAGEIEFCGAAMANVHIRMDLSVALNEVGCIPPGDYGNMLVFVNRGSLAALTRLRGRALGAAEAMLQQLVAPMIDLEVKAWRNAVYNSACNATVPDPTPGFLRP